MGMYDDDKNWNQKSEFYVIKKLGSEEVEEMDESASSQSMQ